MLPRAHGLPRPVSAIGPDHRCSNSSRGCRSTSGCPCMLAGTKRRPLGRPAPGWRSCIEVCGSETGRRARGRYAQRMRAVLQRMGRASLLERDVVEQLARLRAPDRARVAVTHGDICPENQIRTPDGALRPIDEERLALRPLRLRSGASREPLAAGRAVGAGISRRLCVWPWTPGRIPEISSVLDRRGAGYERRVSLQSASEAAADPRRAARARGKRT